MDTELTRKDKLVMGLKLVTDITNMVDLTFTREIQGVAIQLLESARSLQPVITTNLDELIHCTREGLFPIDMITTVSTDIRNLTMFRGVLVTGHPEIDKCTGEGGLIPGNVVTITSNSHRGKTAKLLDIVKSVPENSKHDADIKTILYITSEDSKPLLSVRLAAMIADTPLDVYLHFEDAMDTIRTHYADLGFDLQIVQVDDLDVDGLLNVVKTLSSDIFKVCMVVLDVNLPSPNSHDTTAAIEFSKLSTYAKVTGTAILTSQQVQAKALCDDGDSIEYVKNLVNTNMGTPRPFIVAVNKCKHEGAKVLTSFSYPNTLTLCKNVTEEDRFSIVPFKI